MDFAVLDLYGIDTDVVFAGDTHRLARPDIETPLVQGTLDKSIFDDEAFGKACRSMAALVLCRIDLPIESIKTNQVLGALDLQGPLFRHLVRSGGFDPFFSHEQS